MPNKAPHPCGKPGCPELTHNRYCEKHKAEVDKHYNTYQRDRTAQTFYESPAWRNLRKMKLSQDPFCEECKKSGTLVKATMVDHITPIKQGGERLDMNNLQSLCWSCHSRKSSAEGSRWKRQAGGGLISTAFQEISGAAVTRRKSQNQKSNQKQSKTGK